MGEQGRKELVRSKTWHVVLSTLLYSQLCLLNMFVLWYFLTGSILVPIWGNHVLSQIQCQGLSKIKKERTSGRFLFLWW